MIPDKIIKTPSLTLAAGDDNKLYEFGFIGGINRPFVEKLCGSELAADGERFKRSIVGAAEEFMKLKNVKYRTTKIKLPAKYFVSTDYGVSSLLDGVKPSVALKSIFSDSEAMEIECGYTIAIIYCKAALQYLGEVEFNKEFANLRFEVNESDDNPVNSNILECVQTGTAIQKSPHEFINKLMIGDSVYIKNIDHYSKKHPYGNGQGFNVIYIGNGKFASLFSKNNALTYDEILSELINEYNGTSNSLPMSCVERPVSSNKFDLIGKKTY